MSLRLSNHTLVRLTRDWDLVDGELINFAPAV